MFFWYDPTYWLLIPGLLLAIYAQVRVSSTFGKWQQQMSSTGLTGAQIARQRGRCAHRAGGGQAHRSL